MTGHDTTFNRLGLTPACCLIQGTFQTDIKGVAFRPITDHVQLYKVYFFGYQLKAGQAQSLTVRPELRACRAVEGWTFKPFMVRQAHHERPWTVPP